MRLVSYKYLFMKLAFQFTDFSINILILTLCKIRLKWKQEVKTLEKLANFSII